MTDHGADWTPPARTFRRPHVYALMLLLLALAVAAPFARGIPGSDPSDPYESLLDLGTEPAPAIAPFDDPAPTDPLLPAPAIVSREPEAFAEGFAADSPWREVLIVPGSPHRLSIDAVPGYTYRVLARAEAGCDVDAIIGPDLSDQSVSGDVLLDFYVVQPESIAVEFPVITPSSACTVGLGIYRR